MLESLQIMKDILLKFESRFESYITKEELYKNFNDEYTTDKNKAAFDILVKSRMIELTPELRTLSGTKENYKITFQGILFLKDLMN